MNQIISNVLMQPKPTDAVEHPMALVEKLEQLSDKYLNQYKYYGDNADLNCSSAVDEAIDIVKQHSDWIPVSELPKEEKDWLVRFRKEDGFGLTMAVSKFYLEAQRFDCFHSKVTHYMELPKPPSEVQDD